MEKDSKNQTLYVNNLNEKVKIPALKEKLREIFSEYGNIVDIVAGKSLKRRGQAFIVFASLESASKALSSLQGQNADFGEKFEKKAMRISYARTKSDAIAKIDGTYEEQMKKRKRKFLENEKIKLEERELKRRKKEKRKKDALIPPNKILFVENISEMVKSNVTNTLRFKKIFQNFEGCKQVRFIPQKSVAFVEYESEQQAIVVLQETNNYHLFDKALHISYAKI